jgi:molecular chaperone DnaK (HSP70)
MKPVLGIDLGTTNSAIARGDADSVELLPVRQLVNPGEIQPLNLLPSFLFLPGPADFPAGSTALPWDDAPAQVVGTLAAKRGAENAGRLVASAKSWLSHSGVDRNAAILPAAAPEGVPRVSPVEASRAYLAHLKSASEHDFAAHQILVTVPASFDAVARDLTLKAATEAGYRDVMLLEEPQAAFYAWLERHADWRERVAPNDRVLVIDVGGGTTDFTLIAVHDQKGALTLERLAVGEHILLGGDNMDLALARFLEQRLPKLDPVQFQSLWQQCRAAKEVLLANDGPNEQPVTLLGRGSSLIGGTIKGQLTKAEVRELLLNGFFPQVASTEMPEKAKRSGLQAMGLPYTADAAITRHLAQFLRSVKPGQLTAPTQVLFNGGVFRAPALRERVLAVLNQWLAAEGAPAARPLEGEDLMHAVARGAAYYGVMRQTPGGIRIRGGVPRTYYIGIEESLPAVPFMKPPLKALTVVPFGMEEGTTHRFADREFGLVVGEPAEFRFFVSSTRREDPAGELLERVTDELSELPAMEVTLPANAGDPGVIAATLESTVTETGLLQLWIVARDGRRWKLEFNVRERA